MKDVYTPINNQHEVAHWTNLDALVTGQVLYGGDTASITDGLPTPTEEVSKPRSQVGMNIQIYGLGVDTSVLVLLLHNVLNTFLAYVLVLFLH